MNPLIPYTKPSITELEVRYAAANGWGERCCAFYGHWIVTAC